MQFTTFNGERNIGLLVTRVYGDLAEGNLAKARQMLLKANPQLENIRDVQPGSVLVVPPLIKGRVGAKPAEVQPAAAVVRQVIDAIASFGTKLSAAADNEAADIERTTAILKTQEIAVLRRTFPELQEAIDQVKQVAKERADKVGVARELAKSGTEGITKDLEALEKSLR